jgi:hypothetical protein
VAIPGHTVLDTLLVIDWAVSLLNLEPDVYTGDIPVTAGIDHLIRRMMAVVAPSYWMRPGMEDALHPGNLLPTGESDSYAQYFYHNLNSLIHLSAYTNDSDIHFMCGEIDTHV